MTDEPLKSFWYLATPYTKYAGGREQATKDAAKAAAHMIARKTNVFCPITHSHPVSEHLDPAIDNHDTWLALDRVFMERAVGILVVEMPGWQESFGVNHEIEFFVAAKKPVRFLRWPLQNDVTLHATPA